MTTTARIILTPARVCHQTTYAVIVVDLVAIVAVFAHIDDASASGATIASGGGRRSLPGLADRFPEPTVLVDTGPGMLCWQEETFGPGKSPRR